MVYVTLKTSKGVKCYTIDGLRIKQYHMGLSVTLKASRDVLCLIGKPKGVLYMFFWDHGKPKNGSNASTRTKVNVKTCLMAL